MSTVRKPEAPRDLVAEVAAARSLGRNSSLPRRTRAGAFRVANARHGRRHGYALRLDGARFLGHPRSQGVSTDTRLDPMHRTVRLFLLWLLAVALPMQGAAAAAMLHCSQAQGAGQVATQAHAHHHDHAALQGHADAGHARFATPDDHAAGKTGCSACASCCHALALPAPAIVLPAQEPAFTPFALPAHAAVVFLTDGPERPPRALLA